MKQFVFYFLLSMVFFSCEGNSLSNKAKSLNKPSGQKLSTDTIENTVRKYVYKVDSENPLNIGFVEVEAEGLSISITSICLADSFVYLADEVHKNIKKINLENGEMTISKLISRQTNYKQFADIAVFNNKIYLPSTGKTVHVVDLDFSKETQFYLPTRDINPVFVKNQNDSNIEFIEYFVDSVYTVDKKNEVIGSRKLTTEEAKRWSIMYDLDKGVLKSKDIKLVRKNEGEYITIGSNTIKLCKKFNYFADNFNVDFNDKYLVIFEVDNIELTIFVYPTSTNNNFIER